MSKYYSSSIAFGAKQTKTEKVVVSTTKIGDVTTDAVSGALTVDEVPTLNSLNPVSSDGVARAVIQAGAELPTRGSSDTGKVLTVANSDGDLEWDEPAEELPDMAGNDGKLLGAVDNNGTMEARWVNPPDSYPTVTGNANKVLTVNSGATGVEWADAAGVDVGQDNVVLTGDGDSVKIEFTRVTDTSTTVIEHTNLTGTTNTAQDSTFSSDSWWCCFLAFDLDSVNKTIDAGSNPLLKITSSISVASDTQRNSIKLGFSVITTAISNARGAGVIRESPLSVQDISIKSKISDIYTSSNTLRYLVVQIPAPSNTEASAQELAATVASAISIEGWPVDGYGTKVVIPALPDYSSADAGRVLQVQNDGTLAWVTLS